MTKASRKQRGRAIAKAVALSREFYGLDPRDVTKRRVRWPKALVRIGECAQLNYISDKFDSRLREYYHRFEGRAEVFAASDPQSNGDNLLIVVGDFKLTEAGIEG